MLLGDLVHNKKKQKTQEQVDRTQIHSEIKDKKKLRNQHEDEHTKCKIKTLNRQRNTKIRQISVHPNLIASGLRTNNYSASGELSTLLARRKLSNGERERRLGQRCRLDNAALNPHHVHPPRRWHPKTPPPRMPPLIGRRRAHVTSW